jgi:hypothetical protein
MAKAILTKGFVHNGKAYKIGDEFEGSDAEIEALTRQGYMKRKEGAEEPVPQAVDTGTGKGADVSAGSAGDTGDSHLKTAAEPKVQAKLGRK